MSKFNKANELLSEHESAPSAVNLVLSYFLGTHVPRAVLSRVYENSEGLNDSLRENLLHCLSEAELTYLIEEIQSRRTRDTNSWQDPL